MLKKLTAEAIGTSFLLLSVVGSGIMAERLAAGNLAIALLANAIATGTTLYVLITVLGPISGAHFNPIVTLFDLIEKKLSKHQAATYILVQFVFAVVGVILAHLMFELPLVETSERVRTGPAQYLAEAIATFGFILTIVIGSKSAPHHLSALIACYITAAYWFTASTSFANPAVTLARSLTNTFAGIRPSDVVAFCIAQFTGAIFAFIISKYLTKEVIT